jgi:hypothetical protein
VGSGAVVGDAAATASVGGGGAVDSAAPPQAGNSSAASKIIDRNFFIEASIVKNLSRITRMNEWRE